MEEEHVLAHQADGAAQILQRQIAYVVTIQGDAPAIHVVVAQQQLEQRNILQQASSALLRLSPALSVQRSIGRVEQLRQRLATATNKSISDANHRIALLGRALNSVSPLATLDRGYAIVKSEQTGKVLMTANDVAVGDDIRTHLARGELIATVKSVLPDD